MRLFPLLTGLAMLAAPLAVGADPPDPIQGCFRNTNGRLRIVADTSECNARETGITWPSTQPSAPPTPPRFQLVAFTVATFDGDKGVLGFTAACQAEFDTQFPGSRMCSSDEVMETSTLPTGLPASDFAWVRPSLSGSGSVNNDPSGASAGGSGVACSGWSTPSTAQLGLVTDSGGSFETRACVEFHPVACCAPVL